MSEETNNHVVGGLIGAVGLSVLPDVGKALAEQYQRFKQGVAQQYGADGDLSMAISLLEAKPQAQNRQALLEEAVMTAGGPDDPVLGPLIKALLAAAASQHPEFQFGKIVAGDDISVSHVSGTGIAIGRQAQVKVERGSEEHQPPATAGAEPIHDN